MKQTVPYIDQTQREIPFTDFIIPVNPPVKVSTVYAGQMPLLSEKDHQMCLVKLESLAELYGTTIYVVDKLTGEVHAVIEDTARKIGLQAYVDEKSEGLEGAVGFVPKDAATLKDSKTPGKHISQSSRPSDLSTIDEQTEMSSKLTCRDFRDNRQKFKETPSISSAGEIP